MKLILLYGLLILLFLGMGVYLLSKGAIILRLPSIPLTSFAPTLVPTITVATQSAQQAMVKRVIDGDTIELSDGRKVRYIGIDTPELHHPTKGMQCFGQEAMLKNKELVEGKMVSLRRDVSETDRYKRLLRYVWIPSTSSGQEIFINEYLVREGYALQSTFPPDVQYAAIFKKAAEQARAHNKGLWKSCK